MLTKFVISSVAFITTNLDDICLLVLFFSILKTRKQYKYVILGEYLGIATLVLASMISSLGLSVLLGQYIWVVGFIPLLLGIKSLTAIFKKDNDDDNALLSAEGLWILCFREWAITVANGGDNISVYIPILSSFNYFDYIIFFSTMMIMTTIWWLMAKAIISIRSVSDNIAKVSVYMLPVVFITVGVFTIIKGII